MSQPKIIFVLGPTASGKSALAMRLAAENNGTIINADAMQVYKGLPILSAQPSPEDQAQIPHRLYSIFGLSERSSAAGWAKCARATVQEVLDEGRTAILVGGTGLYIRALTEGLAEIPEIPDSVRADTERLYAEIGEEEFRQKLFKLDHQTAFRLAKNDKQRLTRAYEVAIHTGRALSDWHKQNGGQFDPLFRHATLHLLMPERDALYANCDKRFLQMMDMGALDEVNAYNQHNIDPSLPVAKTIGIRELTAFVQGEVSREDAIINAQQATRNYAKRQMTWFRNQKLNFSPSDSLQA